MNLNIVGIISGIFRILELALIIRILLSWIPHDRHHPAISILYQITDPLLQPFKRLVPLIGGIDFSPIFAFIMLNVMQNVIFRLLGA